MPSERERDPASPQALDWDALYRRYHRDLRRLIARRVPAGAPVDDLVQEAFLQAYRSGNRLDAPPTWSWLAVITERVCITWYRRQRPTAEPWEPREQADPAGFAGSEEHLAGLARHDDVNEVLAGLSPRHRRLLLAQAVGFSHEELARLEGSSPKAVKSALARARTEFRSRYQAPGREGWVVLTGPALRARRRLARPAELVDRVGPWVGALAFGMAAVLATGRGNVPPPNAGLAMPVGRTGISVPAVVAPADRPAGARPLSVDARRELPGPGGAAGNGANADRPLVVVDRDIRTGPNGGLIYLWVEINDPAGGSTTKADFVYPCKGTVTSMLCGVLGQVPTT